MLSEIIKETIPKKDINQEHIQKIINYAHNIKGLIDKKKERFKNYEKFYYLGNDTYAPITLKRLFGELNIIRALIFTPERLVIKPIVTEELTPIQKKLLDRLVDRVQDNFYSFFRLDREIKEAILQALIYGYCPIKVFYYGDGVLYKIVPVYNFGVLYESLDLEDRQQVILHITHLTKEKIQKDYNIDIEKIIAEEVSTKKETAHLKIYALTKEYGMLTYSPSEEEFWEPDNAEKLYPIWEIYLNEMYHFGTGQDIWHRFVYIPTLNSIIAQQKLLTYHHPFFVIRTLPLPRNIYGLSLVELIKDIQKQRIKCLNDIEELTELRTHPPFVITSQAVSKDTIKEDVEELVSPGGILVVQDPQANIQNFPPATGLQELYTKLDYWNEQVKFVSGLFEIIMGETIKGARGMGEILATFASSIFRDMAHEIQTTLEQIFTYTANLFKLYSKEDIIIDGQRFRFADFPYFVRFEIESYSASPIKLREVKELMLLLYKMGDIPADILFKVFNLPFYDEYKDFQKTKAEVQVLLAREKEKGEESK